MPNHNATSRRACLIGILCLAPAFQALAEDADTSAIPVIPVETLAQPAPPAEDTTESGQAQRLDDIVVTATKRAQSVRDIPVSINALQGDELEKIGAREMKDFLDQVPGISLQEESADKPRKIAIRGVGPSDAANQTTGILFGDVPLTDPYGTLAIADIDPFDLRTVEILKGPQGTLFGASALNGAIRYVPNEPEFEQWQGKLFVDWVDVAEGDSGTSYGVMLNAPIGETAALRASGVYQNVPGVIDIRTANRPEQRDADSAQKWTGRAQLRWQATERFGLNLSYLHQERDVDQMSFVTNDEARLEREDAPRPNEVNLVFDVASIDARYAFDWATLVSVTGYQMKDTLFDLDASYTLAEPLALLGIPSVGAYKTSTASGLTQELRLVSPDGGRWNWMAGLFYDTYTADIYANIYFANTDLIGSVPVIGPLLAQTLPGVIGAVTTDQGVSLASQTFAPLDAEEYALFGEISRELGERWTVTLGGRLYRSSIGGTGINRGLLTVIAQQSTQDARELGVQSEGISPKLAVTYQASDDVYVYANVSRGFQFGGININAADIGGEDHSTFKSSTLWNYELGLRTDWLERTLRLDVTLFHLDWTNPQVSQIAEPGLAGYVDNVGGSESNGVEASFRWLTPLPGLSLNMAASYIVARTTEPFEAAGGEEIAVGTEMPLSPKFQIANTLSYSTLKGPWLVGTQLIHSHQGEAWNNIEHDRTVYGFSTLNLAFSLARPDLRFAPAITFSANNLTDERELIGAASGEKTPLTALPLTYNRPRSFGVRVTAEF